MPLKGFKLALGFSNLIKGKQQQQHNAIGSNSPSKLSRNARPRSSQLQGSDDDITIITLTQDHYSSTQESRKSDGGRDSGPKPESKLQVKDEDEDSESETRERQLQIERLRNILEFNQVQATSNNSETTTDSSLRTKITTETAQHEKRVKAIEQQLRRIEGLRRERGELQRKCHELQMRYDRTQEELRARRYAAAQQVRKPMVTVPVGGAERS